MDTTYRERFKLVGTPGLYDDVLECKQCGYQFLEQADCTSEENAKRAEHCCEHKVVTS